MIKFYLKFLLFLCVSCFCQNVFAQSGNGIYGEKYYQNMVFSAGANYYFGDIEKIGIFSKYWKNQVNAFGQVGYEKCIYKKKLKFRADLLASMLNGERNDHSFKSYIVIPEAVLEYYPITIRKKRCNCDDKTIGLYLYGGIGLALYHVNLNTPSKEIKHFSFVPTAALGLGYKFYISPRVELGLEFDYRFALLDELNSSLDGYPYKKDNGAIVGEYTSNWNDGFYTFGLICSYHF